MEFLGFLNSLLEQARDGRMEVKMRMRAKAIMARIVGVKSIGIVTDECKGDGD